MIKVKVEKLQKSFGSLEVLKGIDLEVKEGEVVCLIGPSGSGKSTFLRCLNRLEETTAGTVIVDDNDITDPKCNINKVRENIGMVFQQFNLFPHLNVLENIMLAPVDRKKLTKAEAKQTAERLLATVGLAEKAGVRGGDCARSHCGREEKRGAKQHHQRNLCRRRGGGGHPQTVSGGGHCGRLKGRIPRIASVNTLEIRGLTSVHMATK